MATGQNLYDQPEKRELSLGAYGVDGIRLHRRYLHFCLRLRPQLVHLQ